MADSNALDAPKRPPGRPKGYPRSGGRKPNEFNKLPVELRRYINRRGRPLDFLAAIAAGRKVTAADPADAGRKVSVYPSMAERVSAARVLLNKLLPDLRATELSGPEGGPIPVETTDMSDVEVARRVAFLLASVDHQAAEAARAALPPRTPEPVVMPAKAPEPPQDALEPVAAPLPTEPPQSPPEPAPATIVELFPLPRAKYPPLYDEDWPA